VKLLILTQVIDKNDPLLGFFHTWTEEFSKQFESVVVVCLQKGIHDLPENVKVYSLGKEEGVSKFTYIRRFFSYILTNRNEYSAVYVHMNQEYVLLGGWMWRLMGKKVTMWRNHFAGSICTDIAALFCHKVFCTSRFSYTAKFKKTVFMPVGVPENMFTGLEGVERTPHSVLSLVRISPAKKLEQLVEALAILKEKSVPFTATIAGDVSKEHEAYGKRIHDMVEEKGLVDVISFTGGVAYAEVPKVFARYDITVNQSPSGMYDKTIFEAMLAGSLSLSCNENLRGIIDDMFVFREDDVKDLAEKLETLLALESREREEKAKELAGYAKNNHSLSFLAKRLKEELS